MRTLTLTLMALSAIPASAGDYDDARRAAAFTAAINVCGANIPQDVRRVLYSRMLKGFDTPSQVAYSVGVEANAISKLPPADRQAMCDAINDRIKAGVQ